MDCVIFICTGNYYRKVIALVRQLAKQNPGTAFHESFGRV